MSGSSGDTKDVGREAAEAAAGDSAKNAGRGTAEHAAPAKTADAPSKPSVASAVRRRMPVLAIDSRMAAVATVALLVGAGFGMLSAPRGTDSGTLARIEAGLQVNRGEAARLGAELDGLARALGGLREAAETGRSETRATAAGVVERLTRMEQGLDRKIAALSETVGRVEREAAVPMAATPAQAEKRAATPVTVAAATTPTVVSAAPAKPEPTQTASIETKQKPETIEAWALRDVYDGVAMLEDRKRRLVEVAPGDSVPGVGRVEAIERRGRSWVVITRQGMITPQMW